MRHPFIGSISSRLEFVSTKNIPTAATDGKAIYYNPDYFSNLSKGEIVFVVAHEILHVVYDHIFRRGNRNPMIWNMAVDYIVNYTLVKNNIGVMPKGGLFDERFTDEFTSEELYEKLCENEGNKNTKIDYNFDVHLDGPTDKTDPQSKGDFNINIRALGKEITEEELEDIRNEIKSTIFGLKSAFANSGNIPAGIERHIDRLCEPKVNWKEVISNFVRSSVKQDYNFRKPSNKSWVYNILLPSFDVGNEINAHIFIDASGSITDAMLAEFLSEIKNIAESGFDTYNLWVSSFDTEVYNSKLFTRDNIDELENYKVKGGGGTEFECIFEYLKNNCTEPPKTIIVFTDGYPNNTWGDPNYCEETIFLINNKDKKIKAPFGITVRYEN